MKAATSALNASNQYRADFQAPARSPQSNAYIFNKRDACSDDCIAKTTRERAPKLRPPPSLLPSSHPTTSTAPSAPPPLDGSPAESGSRPAEPDRVRWALLRPAGRTGSHRTLGATKGTVRSRGAKTGSGPTSRAEVARSKPGLARRRARAQGRRPIRSEQGTCAPP